MSKTAITPDPRIEWPAGYSPASALVFTHHEVNINAPPDTVWALLINCTAWPRWYKHCSDVSLPDSRTLLEEGSQFRFKTLRVFFEPKVVTFLPTQALTWAASGPAWTSGAHAWYIEPTAAGCRVVTEEVQKGLMLRVVGRRVQNDLEANHEDWVQSLKSMAESTVDGPFRTNGIIGPKGNSFPSHR